MNKRKLFTLLLLLCNSIFIYAQTDFRPGYVIKNSGDTLFGKIDYRNETRMSKLCIFKNNANVISRYSPDEIKAFRYNDGKYYVSKTINSTKIFLEFLIKGKISIFYYRNENEEHYYLEKDDENLTEIPFDEGMKLVDEIRYRFKSVKHKGILTYYMSDAPNLQARIQAMDKPEQGKLIKLAEDYHNTVCKTEKCIIYEKQLPRFKLIPEFIFGVTKYPNSENSRNNFYTNFGILAHIWMPRTNEKLYFRTGLIHSPLPKEIGDKSSLKMPLHLKYIYPKGIFRPHFSYGVNYYFPDYLYLTVSGNAGAYIKINKKLHLSLNAEMEYTTFMLLVPNEYVAYSINGGLAFKLN